MRGKWLEDLYGSPRAALDAQGAIGNGGSDGQFLRKVLGSQTRLDFLGVDRDDTGRSSRALIAGRGGSEAAAQMQRVRSLSDAESRPVDSPRDLTPAARELGQAIQNRDTKASRILARLQVGPATSRELADITHRFSARILELRQAGHVIEREDHMLAGVEWSNYTLRGVR